MIDNVGVSESSTNPPVRRMANKDHQCSECRRTISRGEIYIIHTVVTRGEGWTRYKVCGHCYVIQNFLLVECHGYLFQGVLEDIEMHLEGDHPPGRYFWLLRTVRNMRRKWTFNGKLVPLPTPGTDKHSVR